MANKSILVADDDPRLREVVRYALCRAGFDVIEASDGQQALDRLSEQTFSLVVLDVLMPELDGLEVCRRVRQTSRVPIVFLSSRGEEIDRVLGLELGGDDYIAKPFSPRELVSRVKAVLRRTEGDPVGEVEEDEGAKALSAGGVRLDPVAHRVWVAQAEISLTVTEFRILQVLMAHPGRAYDRDALTDRAYPDAHHVSHRTLDSHVRRIRGKLREAGVDPIETVHGLGYRMRA